MRAARSFRLLLVPAALLAAACDDSSSPLEPPALEGETPVPGEGTPIRQDLASLLGDRAHWADGYTFASSPQASSYSPLAHFSFNRSGGTITIRKPDGTTGRYVVTFSGLSELLGSKTTVHVTAFGTDSYCKPAAASLASDKVEVRCFRLATGVPANAPFKVLVTRSYPDLAFAYAHQPTSTSYSPAAPGSYNPVGTSTVIRTGVGRYQVVFNKLGSELPAGVGGHVQVGAVGTGGAYCNAYNWATSSGNLGVEVRCFTSSGAAADSKFTVLFLVPTDHLAYAWADQPTPPGGYSPLATYSSNPASGAIYINRLDTGKYLVNWQNARGEIIGIGDSQATGYGSTAKCVLTDFGYDHAQVTCFAPNGAPVDSRFTVLLGS
jgi:hypothetical protein